MGFTKDNKVCKDFARDCNGNAVFFRKVEDWGKIPGNAGAAQPYRGIILIERLK